MNSLIVARRPFIRHALRIGQFFRSLAFYVSVKTYLNSYVNNLLYSLSRAFYNTVFVLLPPLFAFEILICYCSLDFDFYRQRKL